MSMGTDLLRRDEGALVAEIEAAGGTVKGKTVHCPFHGPDKHPSASIYADQNGAWRFRCHRCDASGDVFDLRSQNSGKDLATVLREAGGTATAPKTTAAAPAPEPKEDLEMLTLEQWRERLRPQQVYRYVNPDTGRADMIVFRIPRGDGKYFLPFHTPDQDSGLLVMKAPDAPRPIYNRTRLRDVGTAVLVEGEGVVHSLHGVNIVATSTPGGAGNGEYADLRPLAGKKVILWPDHDSAGVEHMRGLILRLEALEPSPTLFWVDPALLGLDEKGDATDLLGLHEGQSVEVKRRAVLDVLDAAVPLGASQDLAQRIEKTITGTRSSIPWPWPHLTRLTKALLPGTLTLVAGPAGCGKSFFLLEAAMCWHEKGVRLALLELEDGREFHMNRCLAQLSGNSRLLDDDWVRDNPDDAREALAMHTDTLDSFGQRVHEMSGVDLTLPVLSKWVHERAAAGTRIIVVDPVSAADSTASPWLADRNFVFACKAAAEEFGASIVLATHPKKNRRGAVGLDELSGGASYSRFAQTVLWIESHHPAKTVAVDMAFGPTEYSINRTVRLSKVRNASGGGLRLGYGFDGMSLRFKEHGVIRQKKETAQ